MPHESSITKLCILALMSGLLLGSSLNGYMLLCGWPMPFAPALITFGSAISGAACLSLVIMALTKTYTRYLLIPLFLAGMSPAFCVIVLCLAGVLDDFSFRAFTNGGVLLSLSVIGLLLIPRTDTPLGGSTVRLEPTLGGTKNA